MNIRFFEHESVESTNQLALDLFQASGLKEPVFVFAREQTAGRGRHGRLWASPRGGAWCSLAWAIRPDVDHAAASLVAGLATRDAVARACLRIGLDTSRISIKWPNDLLLDCDPKRPGRELRKFAGVLCERPEKDTLVIGVGVNADFEVDAIPEILNEPPRTPSTTLRTAFKKSVDPEQIARELAEALPASLRAFERGGFAPFAPELRAALAHLGEPVAWETPSGRVFGRISGVDDAGRLLLDVGTPELAVLSSGEVSRVPDSGGPQWPGPDKP
ncbi:MAG: biotin--[acetyl-CoA-carboxylase] ligase [Phycisphaerales bacterium]|nr:MAG: biotin--[acetyl-CoA-carboxylase] ligase [Phycisphaerales bacterium]